MITLLPELTQHLEPLQDRLSCFCEYGIQAEGWFKAELLTLFATLLRRGEIDALDREVRQPGGKIDLYLEVGGQPHWVELKHWLIGRQRGVCYGPEFYFGDPTQVEFVRDIDKLLGLDVPGMRWLLILLTANPGRAAWQAGARKFRDRFAPRLLRPCSDPTDYPPTYFLGLMEVSQAPLRVIHSSRGAVRHPALPLGPMGLRDLLPDNAGTRRYSDTATALVGV